MTDDETTSYRIAQLEKSNERLEKKFEDLQGTLTHLIITVMTATVVVFLTFILSALRR